METDSLKTDLIHWIQQIQDLSILNALTELKKSLEKGDWYDSLTEAQKQSIQKGMEDVKNGRIYASKEFWALYEKRM